MKLVVYYYKHFLNTFKDEIIWDQNSLIIIVTIKSGWQYDSPHLLPGSVLLQLVDPVLAVHQGHHRPPPRQQLQLHRVYLLWKYSEKVVWEISCFFLDITLRFAKKKKKCPMYCWFRNFPFSCRKIIISEIENFYTFPKRNFVGNLYLEGWAVASKPRSPGQIVPQSRYCLR